MTAHLDEEGPTYNITESSATVDYKISAGGDEILIAELCDGHPWFGPLLVYPAPVPSSDITIDPPDVDTSAWDGLTIMMTVSAATWPGEEVDCNLTVTTTYDWDLSMEVDYEGEHLSAFQNYSYSTGVFNYTVVSHSFSGPVGSLPTITLHPLYNLLFINAQFHATFIAHSVEDETFVPAPTVPDDPPEPLPVIYDIGGCTVVTPS